MTEVRVLVVGQAGQVYAELENVDLGPVDWDVTAQTEINFTIPATDPKASFMQEWRYEVQVWRGTRRMWWGVITKTINDGITLQVKAQDLSFYFATRIMGRVPKQNLLISNDGEPAGVSGWDPAYLPRSTFFTGPAIAATSEESYNDMAAMRLSSSAGRVTQTYSNDTWYTGSVFNVVGQALLGTLLDTLASFNDRPKVQVKVFDDNVMDRGDSIDRAQARAESVADWILATYPGFKVTIAYPAYRYPLNDNSTVAYRTANRRTTVTYKSVDGEKGHKQHVTQSLEIKHPGPSKRRQRVTFSTYVFIENEVGWAAQMRGIELIRSKTGQNHPDPVWATAGYKKPLQTSVVPFGDGFPTNVWVRVEATVTLPNDGKKSLVEVRLFPPNGDALFSEMWLTKEDSLAYKSREQADIIKGLVKHAQDVTMGKSDFNIGLDVADTGVKRTREYLFSERAVIVDLLAEFPTLANGMEWAIVPSANGHERKFTTYYPRMGADTNVVFASGSNVASYEVSTDGESMATTVIIQAPTGEGSSREERVVSDPTLLDGLILEKAYTGTPNSPASSWRKQAERGLARYRRPAVMPTLRMNPQDTEELLTTVALGDRITTNVVDEVANVDDVQKMRVVHITWDPKTDVMEYGLYPEDLEVVTLSKFTDPVKYLAQAQNPIVGVSGRVPVESNIGYAARSFSDTSWTTVNGSVGWVKTATGTTIVNPQQTPDNLIATTNEVWVRKWVACTGDMVLTVRIADWGYVYVNGHLVTGDYLNGYNRAGQLSWANLRIPAAWLDNSGSQLIALHAQFDPARRSSDEMDSLYAAVQVRGTV